MKSLIFILGAMFLLTGCSRMKIEDFSNQSPNLDLFTYFEGKTKAWGIFEDRFGNLRRQFNVEITGTIDGATLTLDEQFHYADGERDQRIWKIQETSEGKFIGEADDVVGQAEGIVAGNALNWRYDLDLEVGDSTWRVHFDDWMFLQEGDALINRATVSKWGIEIGQVSIFFMRPAGAAGSDAVTIQ